MMVVLGEESLELDEDGEEWHDRLHVFVLREFGMNVTHEALQQFQVMGVDALGL